MRISRKKPIINPKQAATMINISAEFERHSFIIMDSIVITTSRQMEINDFIEIILLNLRGRKEMFYKIYIKKSENLD